MPVRHGDSPVRHAAGGIFLPHRSERLAGFFEPEGMEHRHSAAELRLDRWRAGNREIYLAKSSRVARRMLMLGNDGAREYGANTRKQQCRSQCQAPHVGLLRLLDEPHNGTAHSSARRPPSRRHTRGTPPFLLNATLVSETRGSAECTPLPPMRTRSLIARRGVALP